MYNGVEIISVEVAHSVGNITLSPKAGETSSFIVGGLSVDEVGMAANGQAIYKHTMKPWSVEVAPASWERASNDTILQIKTIQESFEECTFTFSAADGGVYMAKGKFIGEVKGSLLDSNIPITMSGGGKLTKV